MAEFTLQDQLPLGGEYISLRRFSDGKSLIGTVTHPRSQWMRRVIAQALNMGESWDYRTFPNIENIQTTIQEYNK